MLMSAASKYLSSFAAQTLSLTQCSEKDLPKNKNSGYLARVLMLSMIDIPEQKRCEIRRQYCISISSSSNSDGRLSSDALFWCPATSHHHTLPHTTSHTLHSFLLSFFPSSFVNMSPPHTACRGSGTWWGKTEAIPSDPHIIAGPATPDAVLTGDKGAAVGTRESSHPASAAATTHTPLAANAATPPAGRSENYSEGVTAASPGESKGNPPAPGPASNASLPHTPPQHQTASHRTQEEEEEAVEGQEQSRGRASRRRAERQRQNKPAVVREVRLARRSKSGTAVAAAAVLLADGSVWWVPDLQVGTWERVTVSVGDAEVADGVTEEGLLSSAGVSAVAVVGLSPGPSFADKENTVASDRGGESVAKKLGGGGCGVAIVASRDDGWLFLLSRGRPLPSVDSDGGRGDQPSSQLLDWRVSAAWKGHRSRVTAVWAVRDASQSRSPRAPAGGAQVFTAALDTSRLSNLPSSRRRHGVRLDGALVSAGADGTVAWWEWASGEEGPSMVHDGSGCEEMTMSAPKLRMVSGFAYMVER